MTPARRKPAAFTLLELMLVLLIVALVTSRAVVVWSGTYHKARFESALERLEHLDQHARRYARLRGETYELVFDTRRQRIGRPSTRGRQTKTQWEPLPRGVEMQRVELVGLKSRTDQKRLAFDRQGVSTTYGIHVTGPGEREAWLVVAGVSGQSIPLSTEREFHETFTALKRADAR